MGLWDHIVQVCGPPLPPWSTNACLKRPPVPQRLSEHQGLHICLCFVGPLPPLWVFVCFVRFVSVFWVYGSYLCRVRGISDRLSRLSDSPGYPPPSPQRKIFQIVRVRGISDRLSRLSDCLGYPPPRKKNSNCLGYGYLGHLVQLSGLSRLPPPPTKKFLNCPG